MIKLHLHPSYNYLFKLNLDVIWGLVGLFRCLLQKTCSIMCLQSSGSKLHSTVQPAKLRHIGLRRMVPWNRRPPQEGSIVTSKMVLLNPKRFYRTPFWPLRGFWTPVKNHGRGSIEPFASNPPFQVTLSRTFLIRRGFLQKCTPLLAIGALSAKWTAGPNMLGYFSLGVTLDSAETPFAKTPLPLVPQFRKIGKRDSSPRSSRWWNLSFWKWKSAVDFWW